MWSPLLPPPRPLSPSPSPKSCPIYLRLTFRKASMSGLTSIQKHPTSRPLHLDERYHATCCTLSEGCYLLCTDLSFTTWTYLVMSTSLMLTKTICFSSFSHIFFFLFPPCLLALFCQQRSSSAVMTTRSIFQITDQAANGTIRGLCFEHRPCDSI